MHSIFITAEKGGVARAKGGGEKENECTIESLLAPEEIDKLVVRMNREFMEFMRHNYSNVAKCSFSKHPHTILSEKDNTEESTPDGCYFLVAFDVVLLQLKKEE